MDVEAEVIALAQTGDEVALNRLLAAVRPAVVRRCARILPFPDDAEEAAQETLLSISLHLSSYDGHGSFDGWVGAIAANQARMTYRALKRRFGEVDIATSPEPLDPSRVSVVVGSRIDLLEALEDLEAAHPDAVEPFVLRDLGQLTYDEIAQSTGMPLGTVKSHIHRARTFVRPKLVEKYSN